jgi:hypothetical protein
MLKLHKDLPKARIAPDKTENTGALPVFPVSSDNAARICRVLSQERERATLYALRFTPEERPTADS